VPPELSPKITDFGLARFLEEGDGSLRTRSGEVIGTPSYMAPEQAAGRVREAGPAIDVYALGAILYELLTGRPPFNAETPLATLLQVQYQEPVSVTRLRPGTPRDLATVTMKCLEKEPRRRYASAAALADDLARFRAGRPVLARRLSWAGRAWRWSRRNPAVASLLLALTLVFAAGFGAALWEMKQARDNAVAESQARQDAEEQKQLAQQREREADELRRRAERGEALAVFDQGLTRCQQGDMVSGLLLLADSLAKAERGGADDLPHAIRCNLAAWSLQLVPITASPAQGSATTAAAWAPDGSVVATGNVGNAWAAAGPAEIRLWDPRTWKPVGKPLAHPLAIWALAFSQDGKTLLAGCGVNTFSGQDAAGEIRCWDVAGGQPADQPLPVPAGVQAIAFRRDGKAFAAACRDGAVRQWDAATHKPLGEPLRPPTAPGQTRPAAIRAVAYSRDGKTLYAAAGRSVWSWDTATGAAGEALPHAAEVLSLAVSPDGRRLLTGSTDYSARLWDVAAGRPLGPPLASQSPVRSVAFHPSKPLLVIAGGRRSPSRFGEAAVQVWDADALTPVGPPLIEGGLVHSAVFSPNGRYLLTAAEDGKARRADVSRLYPLALAVRHPPGVRSVRFCPDGRSLLTAAAPEGLPAGEGEVRLWDATTGRPVAGPVPARKEAPNGPGFRLDFSPDGKVLRNHVQNGFWLLRDLATGRRIGPPEDKGATGHRSGFRPDGKQLVVLTDGAALLWDVAANRQVGPPIEHKRSVTAAAFGPDGTTVLTAGGDGSTRLWDLATRRPLGAAPQQAAPVVGLAFAPDGRTFLTADHADIVRRWDSQTGQPVGPTFHDPEKGERERYVALSVTPDGAYVTADSRVALRVWEAASGRPVLVTGNLGSQWSPDGKWLALIPGDTYSDPGWGAITLWGAGHWRRLMGTWSTEHSMSFHPGGRILAAGRDKAAGLWDAATGKPIGPPLGHPADLFALHFSPDGRRLATCCNDEAARIWDVPHPVEGDLERIRLWVEVLTGHELNESGDAQRLSAAEQQRRRDRLAAVGGPPAG
jgi:WD40 repeat protein